MEAQYGKFLDMIRVVRINVPLIDVLAGMPNYDKFLKELIRNKHKIEQISAAFLSDKSSVMIQNKVPPKLGDPKSFINSCNFNKTFFCNTLADLGASINLMPYSLYAKLSPETLKPSKIRVRLADKSFQYPIAIAENMLVKVDVIDEILEEDFDALLDEGSKILHSIDGTILEEEIFAEFDEFMLSKEKRDKLVSVLKKHKQAFAWKTTNILGICPSFCKHKIQLQDDKKPVVQKPRRLNPNIQEVVRKEIMKLLDTGIIDPIADRTWVQSDSCTCLKVTFCSELRSSELYNWFIEDKFSSSRELLCCPSFARTASPYTLSIVVVLAIPAIENSPAVLEHTTVKTLQTMFPKNKAHYESEKEAMHLILTRIGDEIYSTVDACKTTQEMWKAIERLQQGESLNIQDVKTNLFWEFRNSPLMIQKQWNLITQEWSRFVTIVKQQHKLDEVLYHKYIMKQYQKEVNELHAERIARNANPNKGKKIAKPITSSSESAFEEDNDPEQAQKDKDMAITVARARENVGSLVLQQTRIQCFNYKEFGYFVKECRKPKRKKDDSDVTHDSSNMYENDIQTNQNAEDERAELANLIANLKLDVDENKKIQKHLNKANTSGAHELEQCKSILAETSKTLKDSNRIQDSCLVALQTKQTEFEKYKGCNDRTVDYDKLKRK
nr:reverse transcriptase domain-containing protein [Tanacetum cinerariifolium]